mmetsp:Transcript_55690/g.156839  ORF Transcript_55690/g.156839 Transcript_55690/m.156839 type:complete len:364 (+) Transcript_55690:101-1192(+)
MPAEKRAAQQATPSAAKRAKRVKEIAPGIEAVVAAIEDAGLPADVPAEVRAMLAAGAPAAFGTPVEERHPLQTRVVGLITDFFQSRKIRENLESKVASAKSAVDKKQNDISTMSNTLEVANSELADATGVQSAQDAKVKEGEAAVLALHNEEKKTKTGKRALERAGAALEKEKARYVSLGGTVSALTEGTIEAGKERQKTLAALVKDLQKLGAEDALVSSASASLSKPPGDRQSFDTIIVDSIKSFVAALVTQVDQKLAGNQAEAAEADKSLEKTAEAVEKLVAQGQEQSQLLKVATEKQSEKAAAMNAAELALSAGRAELVDSLDVQSSCEAELRKFDDILAELNGLASWSLAPGEEAERGA